MQLSEPTHEGARVMSVCNACRYCEQYCPVFKAMEQRLTFASADLNYLANLCHTCGECLYACQYAPPHEFAINVPKTLTRIRVQSYAQYAWPAALGAAFRQHNLATALLAVAALTVVLFVAALSLGGAVVLDSDASADFYAVMPHSVMVALFGGVGLFVLAALAIGVRRCWGDLESTVESNPQRGGFGHALRDALTLRHLHNNDADCVSAPEVRTPWRRRFHHATFYGFVLCFASTSVAALYHFAGSPAPYAYTSLPVLLGAIGGLSLVIGAAGLLALRRRRDRALSDPSQDGLDNAFIALLLITAITGLLLLALRHQAAMGLLLVVHLGSVLALFLTLPYGKFVHGLYRLAALLKYAREES